MIKNIAKTVNFWGCTRTAVVTDCKNEDNQLQNKQKNTKDEVAYPGNDKVGQEKVARKYWEGQQDAG